MAVCDELDLTYWETERLHCLSLSPIRMTPLILSYSSFTRSFLTCCVTGRMMLMTGAADSRPMPLDEFANIGQIQKSEKLIAGIRSREMSASII